jgi:hypothetical protein
MKLRKTFVCVLLVFPSLCLAQAKNILFYGNSFTIGVGFGSSRSVDSLVREVAMSAGHPQPYTRSAASAGQSLEWHRLNNTAVITSGIPAGQKWDHVVLQDFSTQPTQIGNLALHRSSFVGLYEAVRNHSPNVKAVGFETWARAPGHSFYTGGSPAFPGGPAQMQQQLRDGYALSTADVNALYGPGTSVVSPVGSGWQNAGFPLNFYASDLYHAANRGTLLTSLMLYATIYGDNTVSDIDLTSVLGSLGLSASDGALITAVVENTIPEPAFAMTLLPALGGLLLRRR